MIYTGLGVQGLTIKPLHDIRGLEYKDDNYMGLGVQGVTLQKVKILLSMVKKNT